MKNYIIISIFIFGLFLISCEDKSTEPYNPKILFNLYWDIYSINYDGSEETILTDEPGYIYFGKANFTNNGKNIIYQRNENSISQIYKMELDGSNKINISNTASSDFNPVLSNRSNLIYYLSKENDTIQICRMDINGNNKTNLFTSEVFNPYSLKISFDDRKLFFIDSIYNYSIDTDGNNLNLINTTTDMGKIVLSPTENKIVYHSWRTGTPNVFISDLNGTNEAQLTTTGNADDPKFSPDGQSIIFDFAYLSSGWDQNVYQTDKNGSYFKKLSAGFHHGYLPLGNEIFYETGDSLGGYFWILNLESNKSRLLSSNDGWQYGGIKVQY